MQLPYEKKLGFFTLEKFDFATLVYKNYKKKKSKKTRKESISTIPQNTRTGMSNKIIIHWVWGGNGEKREEKNVLLL